MPRRDSPYGPDTLAIPAYFSAGPDDPGLAAFKRDHPDWFTAGTWTPAPEQPLRPAPDPPAPDAPA